MITIEFTDAPTEQQRDAVKAGIRAYNVKHLPEGDVIPVACIAKDETGEIVGGLTGEQFHQGVFVEFLWVDDTQRHSGVGSALMSKLEQEGRERGVKDLFLDTYSFQALDFYLKLGFKRVGEYTDYPSKGIVKYFLQKAI